MSGNAPTPTLLHHKLCPFCTHIAHARSLDAANLAIADHIEHSHNARIIS